METDRKLYTLLEMLGRYGWSDTAEPGYPVGANGTGVRLLVEAARHIAS